MGNWTTQKPSFLTSQTSRYGFLSAARGYTLLGLLLVLALVVAAVALTPSTGVLSGAAAQPSLTIGNYRLVAFRHARLFLFDYIYKATVKNAGSAAATDVTAIIKTAPSNVTVIDGDLRFGDVPAGASMRSRDTFSIRKRIFAPFNSNNLVWTIAQGQNLAPTADAGPDQSVAPGAQVQLDGSASSDPDGDPLTYQWSLTTKPPASTATLSDPTAVNPTFTVDLSGTYVAQLIVNDGTEDSAPDTVTIGSNSKPVADAGADQTGTVGGLITLDGSGSSDADGETLTYQWSLVTKPAGSTAALSGAASPNPSFTPDLAGPYVAQLIVNDGHTDSDPDTVLVTINLPPNQPPQITSTPVTTATNGGAYSYDVEATDPDGDTLTYALPVALAGMTIHSGTGLISWTPVTTGTFAVEVQVGDGRGGIASQSFTVTVNEALVTVPSVVGLRRAAADSAITGANLAVGTVTEENSDTLLAGHVIRQTPVAGTTVAKASSVDYVVSSGPAGPPLPPDSRHGSTPCRSDGRDHHGCRHVLPLYRPQPHPDRGRGRHHRA